MGKLIEQVQIIDMLAAGPLDLDTDRTLDYVSVKNYRRGLMVLSTSAGTAGDDWNWTIKQATAVAGTSVKDADIVDEIWTKQAATNLTATATWTRTTQTADALISGDATSAEEVSLTVIDLDFSRLDTNNGFDVIGGTITLDASGGAQYGSCILVLYDPRYPQSAPLGAIAD